MAGRRNAGTGTIYQRADGLWVGRVELPRDPVTGERRRKQVTATDRRKLEGKLDRLRLDLREHHDLPTAGMTLERWMDYWLEEIDQSRPMTRAGYRSKIEQYIKPAIGRIRLEHLTADDVRRLERYIVRTRGLSPTTAHQSYQVLAKALGMAARERRVMRNVAKDVDAPRRAVHRATVLSSEEAVQVLRTAAGERLQSRWAAALLTGARQGELLGLEIDRVHDGELELSWQLQRIRLRDGRLDAPADWEHRHLVGGHYLSRPKSRAGWRIIPLVEPLRTAVLERLEAAAAEPNPFGLVWTAEPKRHGLDGMPIDQSADNRAWHQLLERAGVPDMRLHDARHTAVTLLYDLGVAETVIQQLVGQSTVATTRGYRHPTRQPAVEAMTRLGRMLTS